MARRFCLQIFVYKFRHAVKKQSDNILNLYLLFQPCNSSLPSPHLQRVSLVFQFYSETVRSEDINLPSQAPVRRSSKHWNTSISKFLDESSTRT